MNKNVLKWPPFDYKKIFFFFLNIYISCKKKKTKERGGGWREGGGGGGGGGGIGGKTFKTIKFDTKMKTTRLQNR